MHFLWWSDRHADQKKANGVFFSKCGSSLWYCHSNRKLNNAPILICIGKGVVLLMGRGLRQTNSTPAACVCTHTSLNSREHIKRECKNDKSLNTLLIKCTRKNDASHAKYYIHFHSLSVTHMHMKVCPTCQPAYNAMSSQHFMWFHLV